MLQFLKVYWIIGIVFTILEWLINWYISKKPLLAESKEEIIEEVLAYCLETVLWPIQLFMILKEFIQILPEEIKKAKEDR